MSIGKPIHNLPDISLEYKSLAQEDEEVGRLLFEKGKYRHSVYFFLQAMEKYVRSRIFILVDPNNEKYQDRVRTHNLDELLDFLVDIVSGKENIREQVKGQLETYVLCGVKFGQLHNNLRYPYYSERYHSYSGWLVEKEHAEFMEEKLQRLKAFLRDIDMLRR